MKEWKDKRKTGMDKTRIERKERRTQGRNRGWKSLKMKRERKDPEEKKEKKGKDIEGKYRKDTRKERIQEYSIQGRK